MITKKVSINLAQVQEVIKLRGCLNRDSFTPEDDINYEPGQLKLIGFQGNARTVDNPEDEGMFDGEYRFVVSQPSDAEKDFIDFNKLPGLNQPEPAEDVEAQPSAQEDPSGGEDEVDSGSPEPSEDEEPQSQE